ncbi:MAG: tRNA preQ1(34) S-adenosylmethionine ribosyltransferase-isomerase QueA [Betaproteobacteria bacterium]|nr:tRNA preQ1(34) S-adenosylmethionine ribosyltransferase-isomerase QueA [Betaproteobacteria bacterium]
MDNAPAYRLSDFDFALPPELIAQAPAAERGASRLLHVRGGRLADCLFRELPSLLDPRDLLVFNDTRVLRARLHGRKDSGGRIEVMIERILGPREALAQMRASHAPRVGSALAIGPFRLVVAGRDDRLYRVRIDGEGTLEALLETHGEVPLPPYIARPATGDDAARYQTVYATQPGAVAAPTAGLHFDQAMLAALAGRGIASAFVTLHVGAGTFLPVQSENLREHRMHSEWFDIPAATVTAVAAARERGGRVVAVGTTTLRALESSAASDGVLRAGAAETRLFISPGFEFRVVDRLLTNFHLPKSTLLMLVSAFAGYATIRAAYAHAIAGRYRFFSYGDAMLLERGPAVPGSAVSP